MALSTGSTMGSIRSPLARTIVSKLAEDQMDEIRDHSYWYHVDTSQLDPNVSDAFIQSHEDEETKEFCLKSREKSDWIFTELFHSLVTSVLSWFVHQTSINGLLQRGSMFVFSHSQFEALLNLPQSSSGGGVVPRLGRRMIDLGAGDGEVTKKMAPYFDEVYATETSPTMQWRLKEKGFHIVPVESWFEVGFDSEDSGQSNAGIDKASVSLVSENNIGYEKFTAQDSESSLNLNNQKHDIECVKTSNSGGVKSESPSDNNDLLNFKNTATETPENGVTKLSVSENSDSELVNDISDLIGFENIRAEVTTGDSTLLDIDNIVKESSAKRRLQFDFISCLNLLDRCSRPLDLLRNIRSALLSDSGRVLVGVVLPFSPYVEDASAGVDHQPHQRLLVDGSTFEEQVSSLVQDTFTPAGFKLERFTRVPYLCEGDLYQSYYILYDALFLLRPV